jgi:glycosyltransferase involved in cell wall biosynthesis
MKLNIIVAGMYHYKYYVKRLSEREVLSKIYYSHKLNSLSYLKDDEKVNFYLKEYLMYLHMKLFGASSAFSAMRVYNRIWSFFSKKFIVSSDVNLILLQGNNGENIRELKKQGGVIVAEVVNAHPSYLYNLLVNDSKLHGVSFFWSKGILADKLNELGELDSSDYLLAPSSVIADSYVAHGFLKDRILIQAYGVDVGDITIRSCESRREVKDINVLCVGQVFPRKGQYHLMQALFEYGGSYNIKLTLVGDCDDRYLKSISDIGVDYEYIGSLGRDAVLELMAHSDVVLLNSIEDGFGMVIAEAMAIGTPVAVSKYAGVSEVVQRLGGGIVYDPLVYDSVMDAIECCFKGEFPKRTDSLPTWDDYADELIKKFSNLN